MSPHHLKINNVSMGTPILLLPKGKRTFLRIYIPKTGKFPFPEKLQVLHSMMVQQYAPGKVCLSWKHRLSLAHVCCSSAPWGRVAFPKRANCIPPLKSLSSPMNVRGNNTFSSEEMLQLPGLEVSQYTHATTQQSLGSSLPLALSLHQTAECGICNYPHESLGIFWIRVRGIWNQQVNELSLFQLIPAIKDIHSLPLIHKY